MEERDYVFEDTEKIELSIANDLQEQSMLESIRIERYVEKNVQEKKPEIAKGLLAASMICKAISYLPGAQPLMLLEIILKDASTRIYSEPEARNTRVLKIINNHLKDIEEKNDEILKLAKEMKYTDKLEIIKHTIDHMIESMSAKMWANQFHNDITNFEKNRVIFSPNYLGRLFKDTYENKCEENLTELKDICKYVINSRCMYLHITSEYYKHCTSFDEEDMNEKGLMQEYNRFSTDVKNISETMLGICPFFYAIVTLENKNIFNPVYIPEVSQQEENKLCEKISWKNQNGAIETDDGIMYGQNPVEGYAVSVPNKKQSRLGESITSRYRKSRHWFTNTYYIVAGPARMEHDEKTVIGELNDAAIWINGRLEIDKFTGRITYREYDENGSLIQNSTQEFVDNIWCKSGNRMVALNKVSDSSIAEKNKTAAEKLGDTKIMSPQTKKVRNPKNSNVNMDQTKNEKVEGKNKKGSLWSFRFANKKEDDDEEEKVDKEEEGVEEEEGEEQDEEEDEEDKSNNYKKSLNFFKKLSHS